MSEVSSSDGTGSACRTTGTAGDTAGYRHEVCFELTSAEVELFNLLKQFAVESRISETTTIRAAGGWVRDKLMGMQNTDIDIALDSHTGREFAEKLQLWLKQRNITAGLGIIPRNPEQSKHLETATMKVLGIELDFTNLRSESYTDSRIPVIVTDALRRDFTINTLFYNLNEHCIEDFTMQGLADLQKRVIRTPHDPMQTLLDDPLRVLRAMRFSARLDFPLVGPLVAACSSRQVIDALDDKVSRERVGVEVDKMFAHSRRGAALHLIQTCKLASTIFQLPPMVGPLHPHWADDGLTIALAIQDFIDRMSSLDARLVDMMDCTARLLTYAAILYPVKELESPAMVKNKNIPLSTTVMLDSIKRTKKDAHSVAVIHDCAASLLSVLNSLIARAPGFFGELRCGADAATAQLRNGDVNQCTMVQHPPAETCVPTSTCAESAGGTAAVGGGESAPHAAGGASVGTNGRRASQVPMSEWGAQRGRAKQRCTSIHSSEEAAASAATSSATVDDCAGGTCTVGSSGVAYHATRGMAESEIRVLRRQVGSIVAAAGCVDLWQASVVLAALVLTRNLESSSKTSDDNAATDVQDSTAQGCLRSSWYKSPNSTEVLCLVKSVHDAVLWDSEGFMQTAISIKPPINGRELLQLLPKMPKGPLVKEVLNAEVDWWLEYYPDVDKEKCKTYLLQTSSYAKYAA